MDEIKVLWKDIYQSLDGFNELEVFLNSVKDKKIKSTNWNEMDTTYFKLSYE